MKTSSKHVEEQKSVSFRDFVREAGTEGAATVDWGEQQRVAGLWKLLLPSPSFQPSQWQNLYPEQGEKEEQEATVVP